MKFPDVFFLHQRDVPAIEKYLREVRWLQPEEEVLEARLAGQGNMNYVLRVSTGRRSFILKQSRPWVEKYPHIAAPWDRALVEAEFYRTVRELPSVASAMPALLGFDADAHILQLADLGEAPTFEFLYSGGAFGPGELTSLTTYLSDLHAGFRDPALRTSFANAEMRQLNHEHIFRVPFEAGNGLDLDAITPGLAALAHELQIDSAVRRRVEYLGQTYLGAGQCLLHGDYFPGSWMRAADGVRIIDPEFCFFGPPEFDWGVMLAHLALSRMAMDPPVGAHLDPHLLRGFAGVEIMRRLIGVAQLPLPYGVEEKRLMLTRARGFLLANQ